MEERRVVTVLFCDVAGSTELAGQLDPEDWAEIIHEAFSYLIEPVQRYDGTVARLMGDAVLAFFGAPRAHEDDPRRAILAAIDILEGMQPFRERVRRDYGLDFNVRVGINTGLVVVGEFGAAQTFEYTAMGDAINVAARMQQTAMPGTIQVTAETHRLAAPFFEFNALGLIEIKGRPGPVETYRVLRRVAMPGTGRGITGLDVPTIGREPELAMLRRALVDLRAGKGGIIAIVGEAGLGKSRLLADLRREWAQLAGDTARNGHRSIPTWVEDRLVSFETGVPYTLFRGRVRDGFGILDSDLPATIEWEVSAALGDLPEDTRLRAVASVTYLFAVAMPGNGTAAPSPEVFRHGLVEIMDGIWRRRIPVYGPSVYVVDDFHWADPASAELLDPMLEAVADLPLLVVLAARPDRQSPSWAFRQRAAGRFNGRYREVTLAPLDESQSGELVDALLAEADLPDDFKQMIYQKVDGNPFFVEEIIRALIERGVVIADMEGDVTRWRVAPGARLAGVSVPDTLRALLQERIDRLAPEARGVLQLAAVIGRSFSRQILERLAVEPERLDEHLGALERAVLIQRGPDGDELHYFFHHALTWEATYSAILRRHRRETHLRVGEAIEALFAGRLNEQARTLGFHFFQAGDQRAVRYYTVAGDRARALYSFAEAIDDYSQALEMSERFELHQPLAHLHIQRGRARQTLGQIEPAREDFQAALAAARQTGDAHAEWEALAAIGDSWAGIDYGEAGTWFQMALVRAEAIGNRAALAGTYSRLSNWHANQDRVSEAREAALMARAIYADMDDRYGLADALDLLGTVEDIAGNITKMVQYYEQAIAIFEELGDRLRVASIQATICSASASVVFETVVTARVRSAEAFELGEQALELARSVGFRSGQAYALLCLSSAHGTRGRYREGFRTAREGLEIAAEIAHTEWTTLGHLAYGFLYLDTLQPEAAWRHLEASHAIAKTSGSAHFRGFALATLGQAYVADGRLADAADLLGVGDLDTGDWTIGERQVWFARAILAQANGDPERALAIVDRLIATAVNYRQLSDIPRLALLRGEILTALGRLEKAREALLAARDGGLERDVVSTIWRASMALGKLHAHLGDAAAARRDIATGREYAHDLAARELDQPDRDTFLTHFERQLREALPDEMERAPPMS